MFKDVCACWIKLVWWCSGAVILTCPHSLPDLPPSALTWRQWGCPLSGAHSVIGYVVVYLVSQSFVLPVCVGWCVGLLFCFTLVVWSCPNVMGCQEKSVLSSWRPNLEYLCIKQHVTSYKLTVKTFKMQTRVIVLILYDYCRFGPE